MLLTPTRFCFHFRRTGSPYRADVAVPIGRGLLVCIALIGSLPLAQVGFCAEPPKPAAEYRDAIEPLVKKYCVSCHAGEKPKGDVQLARFRDRASVLAERPTWEAVLEMVEFGAMPPEGKPQPTEPERAAIVAWVKDVLFGVDCSEEHDPGRVTIRRLNRADYDNTIRDLIGLEMNLARNFPSDDVGEGFDNIGDVLSLPPLLMEKYLEAAETIAVRAIVAPNAEDAPEQVRDKRRLRGTGSADLGDYGFWHMYSSGAVRGEFDFEKPGRYLIRIEAMADQAGDEPAKMQVRLGDKELQVVEVKAVTDSPEVYEVPLAAKEAGKHTIEAAFINDYYKELTADRAEDRNLYVSRIEVRGPLDLDPASVPESHRRIVVVQPGEGRTVREAARENLFRFISRAYRRQVADDELEKYIGLVEAAVEQGESFEGAMQVAVTAVLVSPQFLFRIERDPDPNDPQRSHALSDFELASRLSYFLWSSMPDSELFQFARAGKLNDPETLRRQVARMLKDPKSAALVENFGGQWLNLRLLDDAAPDPDRFPGVTDDLKQDMRRETELFFETVMREDRSVVEFLTGDFTFVNRRLVKHYSMVDEDGKTNVGGLELDRLSKDEFQRVQFLDGRRAGVLTHASILTLTSNPTRTSPVKRGKWIMENILGTPPPEPPANVPPLETTAKAAPDATHREQLELHRRDPGCASCHRVMDVLGFGFEHFDAVGRWRDTDGRSAVDASGELPGEGAFEGAGELIEILSKRDEDFSRLLARKMLTYALGRGLQPFDECAIDEIADRMQAEDHRFSSLVVGIVLSEPFRMRRGEATKSP